MLTPAQLRTIVQEHRLSSEPVTKPEVPGTVNSVYFFGDCHVVRVATEEGGAARLAKEARVIPLAREAGVRTPALMAVGLVDGSPPIPYMVLERDPGDNLGTLRLESGRTPDAYRALGRDLGL